MLNFDRKKMIMATNNQTYKQRKSLIRLHQKPLCCLIFPEITLDILPCCKLFFLQNEEWRLKYPIRILPNEKERKEKIK